MQWNEFGQRLQATLRTLTDRCYLIVSAPADGGYVQFACATGALTAEASGPGSVGGAATHEADDPADGGDDGRPQWWRRRQPDRPCGAPFEEQHQPAEHGMRQRRDRPPGNDSRQQRQRHDDETDDRNGDGIGQR